MFKVFLTFIVILFSHSTHAQICLESIINAQRELESGNAEYAIQKAQTCLDAGEPELSKWQAYRVKSIAFLLLQQNDSARKAAELMLSINPTYTPMNRTDPQEFIRLLSDIVVIPKFSVGLAVSTGTNISAVNVVTPFLTADYHKNYSRKSALQFGTNIGMSLSPKLILELGLLSSVKKFGIDYKMNEWEVAVEEKQSYLETPLYLKYIFFPRNKFRPYIFGGVFGGYLLYDRADYKATYLTENKSYNLRHLDILERRNRINYGMNGGLGCFYKLNKGHLGLQAAYFQSMVNVNNPEMRMSSEELIFTYFYLDDDFRVNNLSFSVGGVYYLNYMVYKKKK